MKMSSGANVFEGVAWDIGILTCEKEIMIELLVDDFRLSVLKNDDRNALIIFHVTQFSFYRHLFFEV